MTGTAGGYRKMMWGILLSAAHIEIPIANVVCVQIIPMFVGFALILAGCCEIRDKAGVDFFDKGAKNIMITTAVSLGTWVVGLFLSYDLAITKGLMAMTYLFAIGSYGEILNKTVRLYKLEGMIKEADKLRNDRMTFIKVYMFGIVLCLLSMIPQLAGIGRYIVTGVMFALNMWLSMIIQNIAKKDVYYHPQNGQSC